MNIQIEIKGNETYYNGVWVDLKNKECCFEGCTNEKFEDVSTMIQWIDYEIERYNEYKQELYDTRY